MIRAEEAMAAFIASCRDEIDAPKPGNVHTFAAGHGMVAEEFLTSAEAAAGSVTCAGAAVGERILGAVEATFAAVGKNTNLGILLLCCPLAAAAELPGNDLRDNLRSVLAGLDRADAENVFAAIRYANPAGLGNAPRHDVHGPAEADLREIMHAAAERDRIAFQYVSNFRDIFVTGFAALAEARQIGLASPWIAVLVYLRFLAAFPDTHITRKCGTAAALEVQSKSRDILDLFAQKRADSLTDLLAFDAALKAQNRNPGTSADLTVATLFADRLRSILLQHHNNG